MSFTYQGMLDGHDVTGRVADGKISGNPFVTIAVESLVQDGVHVGLGPWSGAATLDDDQLARITIGSVIENARFDPPLAVSPSDAPADAVY